jgi:nucleoside 2-deoxyribosyltransferase
MKIYCGHQISGLRVEEVVSYYDQVRFDLEKIGYTVLSPMTAKDDQFNMLNKDEVFVPGGYSGVASDHSIVERDCWMVSQADIILMNLLGMKKASIGCISETAWAFLLRKHVVLLMEKDNPHQHAFIKEMSDVLLETYDQGIAYLAKLAPVNNR